MRTLSSRVATMLALLLVLGLPASGAGGVQPTTSATAAPAKSTKVTDAQCYFLNGAPSLNSYRCDNTTSGHSTCCQAGAVCYSNGVCKVTNEGIQDWQRVGCTDPTWKDPACLDECSKCESLPSPLVSPTSLLFPYEVEGRGGKGAQLPFSPPRSACQEEKKKKKNI